MTMIITKPLQLTAKHAVIEQDHKFYCVFSATLGFRLSSGEALLEMDAMSESIAAMGANPMPDMGMPKPRAEYLVSGKYFAPGGEPVRGGEVRVSFADNEKSLYVFGDREWVLGQPSEAEWISEMPLDYSRAYGGATYPKNPVGIGFDEDRLPNIENPAQILTSRKANIQPAGLGVIDLRAEQRLSYQGTYDDSYLHKYYPGYPADFDWHGFMCAAEDQWSVEYYQGNEAFELHNLHPQHPLISGKLPGYVSRCFIRKQGASQLQELAMKLDTVWFFPEQDLGLLIWRCGLDVADDDADEIEHLMLAYESQRQAVRTLDYYQRAFDRLTSGDDPLIKQMSSTALIPDTEKSGLQLIQEKGGDSAAAGAFAQNLDARAEAASQQTSERIQAMLEEMQQQTPPDDLAQNTELGKLQEMLANPPEAPLDPDVVAFNERLEALLPGITGGDPKKVSFDDFSFDKLDEMMQAMDVLLENKQALATEQVDRVRTEMEQNLQREMADMGAAHGAEETIQQAQETLSFLDDLDQPPPAPLPRIDSNAIVDELEQLTPQTVEAMQQLQDMKTMGVDEEATRELEQLIRQSTAQQDELRKEQLQQVEQDFKLVYRDTAHHQPAGESPHRQSLDERKQVFLDSANKGVDVSKRDWACLDLSGLNLDGIDLHDAYLEQVNLSNASLRGANLSGAILARATLQGADLTGADLTGANVGAVMAHNARFDRCVLNQAKLSKGDFSAASFNAAQMQGIEFLEVVADGAQFVEAELEELLCLKLNMHGIDFSVANSMTRISRTVSGPRPGWSIACSTAPT
jgi:uncharacterized protein YjbI with pentapeptide repeats